MEKDNRLMEASWLERLTEGETDSWENCMQFRKQQLELDMEQQTYTK